MIKPHYNQIAERINQTNTEYILSIQDNTVLNFTSHKAKIEIGRIGGSGKKSQYGIFQHSTLLVTAENDPLGVIDLQHFSYDDFDQTVDRHQRPIEEKHSICWIKASKNRRKRIGYFKKIITVCDREGDFFEFLFDLNQHQESYVIRAQHDRFTGGKHSKKAEKLSTLLEKAETLGELKTEINDVQTHEIKTINLTIKSIQEVKFPPNAQHLRDNEKYSAITTNVVMAYDENYCWLLLTDLPVNTISDCEKVIKIYKSRWHVEEYHKILKTGYQIDEVYLHSSYKAIINALTMISISACRLYWLIYVGRVEKTIQADQLFEEHEWKTVYVYFKEPIPESSPSLSEVIIKIARMGGYKEKKNGKPPGIKLMWLGFQVYSVATQMYRNCLLLKT